MREQALDPRNFKDSSDSGTLVVRYVVQAQGDKNTVLRINALFKEDFRHIVHPSDGSVETAEYNDIREHVEAIELMKKQNVEAEQERQEHLGKKQNLPASADDSVGGAFPTAPQRSAAPQSARVQSVAPEPAPPQSLPRPAAQLAGSGENPTVQASAPPPPEQSESSQGMTGQALEEHVKDLRKQLERLVKSPGAPLKSAPFHTASTLQSLTTGTEVLILISTPYWYGIETHEGQHGWIMRNQLEQP